MGLTLDVEIFKPGKWNGQEFKPADIAGMIASYNVAEQKAPVTLDHDQAGPAFGWVEKVFKKGSSLWATIGDMAPYLYAALKSKMYATRSVELYRPTDETPQYRLKAVSFLGALIPAVKGMAPVELAAAGAEAVCFAEGEALNVDFEQSESPNEEIPMAGITAPVTVKVDESDIVNAFADIGKQLKREFKTIGDIVALFGELVKENQALGAKVTQFESTTAEASAKALVDKAITSGHALKGQRDALMSLAKSDPKTFADLYGDNAPQIVPLSEVGSKTEGAATSEKKIDSHSEAKKVIDAVTGGANKKKES